jgi:C4-dicarboxylate-specific signal transduction histidine kinase
MHWLLSFALWSLPAISVAAESTAAPEVRSLLVEQEAAGITLRVLDGERPAPILIAEGSIVRTAFDWRGANEIPPPEESDVRFRRLGVWAQYKLQVLALLVTLTIQAGLIAWLVHEHRQRKQAEIRSRNARDELANMKRFAAAGGLSASIAHEINQPICGMVLKANAALRWLTAEKPDVEKARGALSDIVSMGHRAADIVVSVRAMFKQDMNVKAPVSVNNLVDTVLAVVRTDLQSRGVRVETQFDETLPAVNSDPVQLQQVILNLIVNAAEAMRTVQPRVLKIRTNRSVSGMVHGTIEDSGIGISAVDRERIFDPLFTTRSGGMGMGLSICRSIIQNQGGSIWVAPAASRGAIFQFELPAAPAELHCDQAA